MFNNTRNENTRGRTAKCQGHVFEVAHNAAKYQQHLSRRVLFYPGLSTTKTYTSTHSRWVSKVSAADGEYRRTGSEVENTQQGSDVIGDHVLWIVHTYDWCNQIVAADLY